MPVPTPVFWTTVRPKAPGGRVQILSTFVELGFGTITVGV